MITNIAGVLSREVMRGEPGGRLYAESLANILAVHLLRDYAQCTDGRMLEACSAGDKAATDAAHAEPAGRPASQPRAVADAVGFADQSHLTRHLKRILGSRPNSAITPWAAFQDPYQAPGW